MFGFTFCEPIIGHWKNLKLSGSPDHRRVAEDTHREAANPQSVGPGFDRKILFWMKRSQDLKEFGARHGAVFVLEHARLNSSGDLIRLDKYASLTSRESR